MSDTPRFPLPDRPRLWGTAVSHYQVEGGDTCDWTEWERAGRTRGEPCGDAAHSWTHYERDADLAREAGANAFRFSVSWSRIEPKRGAFNDVALGRYRRFIAYLNAINLEPVVTLFHYTHPLWFHRDTPWTGTRSVEAFRRFVEAVVDSFGCAVRVYIPLNEPLVFALAAYYDGQVPPGIADARTLSKVVDNLLAAHCEAAAVIREANPHAAIGIAHNMMAFAPERRLNLLDRMLARVAHHCYNRGLVEACATGKWDFLLPPATRIRGMRPDLPPSLDFFGVNFYSRLHLRCPGKQRLVGEFRYIDAAGHGLTDNGWEIVPEALPALLREATSSGLPVAITENGLADGSDRVRAEYLAQHVAAMASSGVDVHGYFHWSLIDNYEWLDGFTPRFGLYTRDRIARPSVATFRQLGREFVTLHKESSQKSR